MAHDSSFSCLGFVIFWLLVWGLFCSIPTPWGSYTYDLFPPAIRSAE